MEAVKLFLSVTVIIVRSLDHTGELFLLDFYLKHWVFLKVSFSINV